MRKKFLLPIVYLVLFGVVSLTKFEAGLFLLWFPTSLIMLAIEVNGGFEQGTLTGNIWIIIVFDLFFWFLFGCLWDAVSDYFKDRKYDGE